MQIVLWADEFDYEAWQTYCEILGVSANAVNVVLTVTKVTPNFDEDEEEGGADEEEF